MQKLEQDFQRDGGEFKKCRIGDFFIISTGSLLAAEELKSGKVFRVSAKSDNNGILGSYDTESLEDARHFENFISVNFFGDVFYHPYKASVEMKVHVLQRPKLDKETGLYLVGLLKQLFKNRYGYGNQLSSSKLKKEDFDIFVPHQNGEIAFDYMADYIRELEADYIRELEAYLRAAGFSDYTLTPADEASLAAFQEAQWAEFKIVDLFDVKNTNSILSSQIVPNSGSVPYVTAGKGNNSISTYISYNKSKIEEGNSVLIGGKTMVITYQPEDYFSNDSHNLSLRFKDIEKGDKNTYLFVVSALFNSLNPLYSWGNSISKAKIQSDIVWLPIDNKGEPDYQLMTGFIQAVHKLVIKGVAQWSEKKSAAYRRVIQAD